MREIKHISYHAQHFVLTVSSIYKIWALRIQELKILNIIKIDKCQGDFRYNHSQNIGDKLYFAWEIGHYEKSSISIFQKFFASTDTNFHFGKKTEH